MPKLRIDMTQPRLTSKQARFVEEYLIDLNGAQAAIRAGYAPKRADAIAWENLRKPEVAEAIRMALQERSERMQITQDYVIGTIRDTVEALKAGGLAENAQGIFKGSELLGRHLRLFVNRIEHSGRVEIDQRQRDAAVAAALGQAVAIDAESPRGNGQ